jgi:hypothetical protein
MFMNVKAGTERNAALSRSGGGEPALLGYVSSAPYGDETLSYKEQNASSMCNVYSLLPTGGRYQYGATGEITGRGN